MRTRPVASFLFACALAVAARASESPKPSGNAQTQGGARQGAPAPAAVDRRPAPVDSGESRGSGGGLFPLYGVTLGQTTVSEMSRLGDKDAAGFYKIQGANFWHHQATIAQGMYLTYSDRMPERWAQMGWDWKGSYRRWLSVLESLGYKPKVVTAPHKEDFSGKPCFTAKLEALTTDARPVHVELDFKYEPGEEDSAGTLYSISLRMPAGSEAPSAP